MGVNDLRHHLQRQEFRLSTIRTDQVDERRDDGAQVVGWRQVDEERCDREHHRRIPTLQKGKRRIQQQSVVGIDLSSGLLLLNF